MAAHQKGMHERSPLKDQTEIRRQQILDFFKACKVSGQLSPTHREIALAIGWKESSFGTVHPLVEDLIRAGFLTRSAKGARTLTLADPQPAECYYNREQHKGRSPYYPRPEKDGHKKHSPRAHSPEFRERLKLIK